MLGNRYNPYQSQPYANNELYEDEEFYEEEESIPLVE